MIKQCTQYDLSFSSFSLSACTCLLPWLHILHVQRKIKTKNSFKYVQTVSLRRSQNVCNFNKPNISIKEHESQCNTEMQRQCQQRLDGHCLLLVIIGASNKMCLMEPPSQFNVALKPTLHAQTTVWRSSHVGRYFYSCAEKVPLWFY